LQDLLVEFIEAMEKMREEKPDDLMAAGNVLVQRFLDTGLKRLKARARAAPFRHVAAGLPNQPLPFAADDTGRRDHTSEAPRVGLESRRTRDA